MNKNVRELVPLPKKHVQTYTRNGHTYAYRVTRTYRNKKGNPTCDRRSIGKIDDKTGMLIPNLTYYEYYGEVKSNNTDSSTSKTTNNSLIKQDNHTIGTVKEAGITFITTSILHKCGVSLILKNIFGNKTTDILQTVVSYMFLEGNVMSYIDDFCDRSLCRYYIDDRRVSEIFESLTNDKRLEFFCDWSAKQSSSDYIAYDVTSVSSYSKGIEDIEWGYNRDGEKLPQINLGMYLGINSGLPVFYRTYPGSITDKSHLKYMMEDNDDIGIDNVAFVMDCGFASTSNLKYMHSHNYPYIIGIETYRKTSRQAINDLKDSLNKSENWIDSGCCYSAYKTDTFYGVNSRLHVYKDSMRKAQGEIDFYRRLQADEESLSQLHELTKSQVNKYKRHGFDIDCHDDGSFSYKRNSHVIDKLAEQLGYFCILTNDLNLDAKTVLSAYRKKDVIEKSFNEMKNHLDMSRLRTHTQATTEGKMFCAFIALIIRMYIEKKLRKWMTENRMTFERVKRELVKIRFVEGSNNKRLLNPLTKKQREIIECLGFNDNDVKSFIENDGILSV